MILQNVSRTETGALGLLQCDKGPLQFSNIIKLLRLLFGAPDTKKYHPLYRIAQVLQNCTQVPPGRQFLIDKNRNVIKEILVPLSSHQHPTVQGGIFGAIRNCMVDDSLHDWLIEEVGLVSMLAKPLRNNVPKLKERRRVQQEAEGNEEAEEKQKAGRADLEKEMAMYKNIVQSLQLLGGLEGNRPLLKKKKDEIYPHLQDLDLIIGQAVTEDEECVKEAIDSVVQWLVLEEKAAEADLAALSLERDGEAELEAAENEEALEVD